MDSLPFLKVYHDGPFKAFISDVDTASAFIRALLRLDATVHEVHEKAVDEGLHSADADVDGSADQAASSSGAGGLAPAVSLDHIGDRTVSLGREVRRVVYDAYCTVRMPGGDVIETLVEMQNSVHANFVKRMWGYMSFAVASQWRSAWGQVIAKHGEVARGPDVVDPLDDSTDSAATEGSKKRARAGSSASGASGSGGSISSAAAGASSKSTGSGARGRGAAYDFRPTYVIGITNFVIPETRGPHYLPAAAPAAAAASTSSSAAAAAPAPAAASGQRPSPTQWFTMGFDSARYSLQDRRDMGLAAQYGQLTCHAVVQLPYAPTSDQLRGLTAEQARATFPESDLWAALVAHAHTWRDDTVPPVYRQAPFAAALERVRRVHFESSSEFMAAYHLADSLEAGIRDVVEVAEKTRLGYEAARIATEAALKNEAARRAAAEEALAQAAAARAAAEAERAREATARAAAEGAHAAAEAERAREATARAAAEARIATLEAALAAAKAPPQSGGK